MQYEELQAMYAGDDYYWGTDPNDLAETTLQYLDDPDSTRLVDLGAGEGRDSVYFADNGVDVLAVDVAPNGLAKAERLAADRDVDLDTLAADVNDLTLASTVDAVYSIGTVQYVRPENRERQFDHFKSQTAAGGLHSIFAFVDHPDVPPAPDWGDNEYSYDPGELRGYYDDWELCHEEAFVFDDDSGGEPHQHAAEVVVAHKPE